MKCKLMVLGVGGCLLLVATEGIRAQSFAQTTPAAATPGAATPGAATPAVTAPPAATSAPSTQPRAGVAPVGLPASGGAGFIRAGGIGGGRATSYAGSGSARVPDNVFGGMNGFGFSHGEDDADMAKLVESENELTGQSDTLLGEYSRTDDYSKRENLKKQLRETLAKQFDIQRQRRELELGRVEERLNKLREQVKKRNDARETIIDRRLETLTSDAEGLGWSPPAGGGPPWQGPKPPGASSFFPRGAPPTVAR